ncbi:MAG: GspE/PulE family protein, partial [Rhodoferax sp.]
VYQALGSRVKLLSGCNLAEKRRPQDGRIKRDQGGGEIELRVSTMPTAFGEKAVLRIFDPDILLKKVDELGFSAQDLPKFHDFLSKSTGIILVTGPTGSGKTTTLYSALKHLSKPEVNIITIEDPIEMVFEDFDQVAVRPQIEITFASALRTVLRQDPDIIMVGEIRDLETADMAVQAALTGHLVFSTLHTNDAPAAVTRLIELGVPPYLINATVLGVLAQRLVRTLCRQCRVRDETASKQALDDMVKPWHINGHYQPYRAVGCVDCRMTGFRGRMGLYELLTVSEEFRTLVAQGATLDALKRQAVADGMRPLRLAGALRVAEGVTVMEEVLAATPPLR